MNAGPTRPTVLVPLALEAVAVRGLVTGATVVRTGMGPRAAARSAARLREAAAGASRPVAVVGACGALHDGMRPGDLVVATEVWADGRGASAARTRIEAPLLAADLRRLGLRVHEGPLVSVDRLTGRRARPALRATGAIAVDMESAWFVGAAGEGPFAVVRAVSDGPGSELANPVSAMRGGLAALGALRRAAPSIGRWVPATGPRTVLLAGSRSFCAGVERAIEIVERALERHGAPVYVRRQIVHNAHVVRELERRGASFVEEVDEVPEGSVVVFSAHGVSPDVRRRAAERGLRVIDATCPLVTKVHSEARRFADRGYTVFLIGHDAHEEVEGTTGEAPRAIRLIDPDRPDLPSLADRVGSERLAYLTQTTLAVDEVEGLVDELRRRFPSIEGPGSDDICYATQNRQDAVRTIATECDLVLVIGSVNSSNSKRLVEVAQRAGCRAHLIDDATDVRLEWLAGASTVGLTAGASAPETLVERVVEALAGLGPVTVEERHVVEESVRFTLPSGLRRAPERAER